MVVSLSLTVSVAHAATDPRTQTPTPTETLPALPTPPFDGGVVAVHDLTVYEGPGLQFATLGGLPYGALIYPRARSQDALWLQIEYAGFEGWVYRPLVNMGFDPVALSVPAAHVTPLPGGAPAPTLGVETSAPGTPPTASSPSLSATPEPVATQTPLASTSAAATPKPATTASEASTTESPGALPDLNVRRMTLIVVGVVGVALSAGYLLWLRSPTRARQQEFVLAHCPACREGKLSLEHMGRSRRVVRCDNCRSVLRQLRGGQWRYAVDPMPDRDFAARHNGQVFSEEELVALAEQRASKRGSPTD